jgi:hypothetical protein
MRPRLRHSWIIPGRLAVGEHPASFEDLAALGFTAAVSLQEPHEPGPWEEPPEGFAVARVPVQDGLDGGVPAMVQLEAAVEAIRGFLDGGRITYVFCYAGVGRSPVACMAYLGRVVGLDPDEAYRNVVDAHFPTNPTEAQLHALARFLSDAPGG